MAADFSWVPPVAVLTTGMVVGAVVVAWRSRTKSSQTAVSTVEAQKADLQRQYDTLIRRLAEGSEGDDRATIEAQAAQILMKLESGDVGAPAKGVGKTEAPTPAQKEAPKPVSALMGFVYGAGTMAVLGGMLYLAFQGSTPRTEGGSVTGGGGPMGQNAQTGATPSAAEEKALAALEEEVRAAPKDIAKRMDLTRAYLQRRDLMKVFDQTKAVLEIEPGNPHALTYQALVRVAMGQSDMAETMLLDALKKDPNIEDAYIHLAIARIQRSNRKGAEEAIQEAQRRFPEDKEQLAQMFTQLTSAADDRAAAPPDDHAGEAGVDAPPTEAGAAGESKDVVVVVDLPKGVTVPDSALLFVIVREAGFETGPPVAVKRVPATNFPITVTLTNKDSMAGESLPGLVRIDARIDRDGNPLTKDPRDPIANEDNVRPGSGQTLLVLGPPKA